MKHYLARVVILETQPRDTDHTHTGYIAKQPLTTDTLQPHTHTQTEIKSLNTNQHPFYHRHQT